MFAQSILSGHLPGSSLFVTSAIIGFAAALPLGPVSILTVQRAMTLGFRRGFRPSMGAVAGAGILGGGAALGSGFPTVLVPGNSF